MCIVFTTKKSNENSPHAAARSLQHENPSRNEKWKMSRGCRMWQARASTFLVAALRANKKKKRLNLMPISMRWSSMAETEKLDYIWLFKEDTGISFVSSLFYFTSLSLLVFGKVISLQPSRVFWPTFQLDYMQSGTSERSSRSQTNDEWVLTLFQCNDWWLYSTVFHCMYRWQESATQEHIKVGPIHIES